MFRLPILNLRMCPPGPRRRQPLVSSIEWIGSMTLFLLILFLIISAIIGEWIDSLSSSSTSTPSPYVIIIDGGSTGSRLHIFQFSDDEVVRHGSARADVPLSAYSPVDKGTSLDPAYVAEHLMPAFRFAAKQIPSHYHATTLVQYQATAGMRLLEEWQQQLVYDALYFGLLQNRDFVFTSLRRSDLQTLSGELEGYYGALAANYLQGTCTANLTLVNAVADHPVGALDMGGSSTQIVFLPKAAQHQVTPKKLTPGDDYNTFSQTCGRENMYKSIPFESSSESSIVMDDALGDIETSTCYSNILDKENDDIDKSKQRQLEQHTVTASLEESTHFFSTSYLSYGVDQFRERLWTTWVQERKEKDNNVSFCRGQQVDQNQYQQLANGKKTCDSKVIENPCGFPGYKLVWQGYTLVGSGNVTSCVREVQRLIPHPTLPISLQSSVLSNNQNEGDLDLTSFGDANSTVEFKCHDESSPKLLNVVGGIRHPPVAGQRFVAMSLYFFALDSLRELSKSDPLNKSWPNPTLQELVDALPALCQRSWVDDLVFVQHNAHRFTRAEVLPHRCMESVYIVTLLRDGFGFDPHTRDITFLYETDDGNEVEWTLGMALHVRRKLDLEAFNSKNVMIESQHSMQQRDFSRRKIEGLSSSSMNRTDIVTAITTKDLSKDTSKENRSSVTSTTIVESTSHDKDCKNCDFSKTNKGSKRKITKTTLTNLFRGPYEFVLGTFSPSYSS